MVETMDELIRQLIQCAEELAAAYAGHDRERAAERARKVLSLGSKVHQRLGLLVDLDREARWLAGVDRAVAKAKPELPGQLSIVEALREEKKPRARREPRA